MTRKYEIENILWGWYNWHKKTFEVFICSLGGIMYVQMVIKFDKKYLTEDIITAFGTWGRKSFHSAVGVVEDIIGMYYQPVNGTILLGNHRAKHEGIVDGFHRRRRYSNIILAVYVGDIAKPGSSIPEQYNQFMKEVEASRKKLENIGYCIMEALGADPAMEMIFI